MIGVLAQEGASIPIEIVLTAIATGIVAIVGAFGVPKLLEMRQKHEAAQNETAMGMLKIVITAQTETSRDNTAQLVQLVAVSRQQTSQIESQAIAIQRLQSQLERALEDRGANPVAELSYDTPPIGALGSGNDG